jgi:hypothetical protein
VSPGLFDLLLCVVEDVSKAPRKFSAARLSKYSSPSKSRGGDGPSGLSLGSSLYPSFLDFDQPGNEARYIFLCGQSLTVFVSSDFQWS